MTVNVKLIGSFCSLSGKSMVRLGMNQPCPIRDLITVIADQFPKLKPAVIDSESGSLKNNVLMLVNGKELSILNHFDTMIKDGDEVVLVPIVHGG